jgi:hypothetical protein
MFSKRFFVLIVASSLALAGCAAVSDLLPDKKATSVLSGREGIDGQVLAVKIDDTNAAHPQIGLEDAEIVYIEQVEGGLTRLAAIFSTVIPQRVGPVRSARISDIDILSQFGRVAFCFIWGPPSSSDCCSKSSRFGCTTAKPDDLYHRPNTQSTFCDGS